MADTWPEALDSVDVDEGGAGRVIARALAKARENQRPRRAGVVLARIDALDRAGHRHGFDSWDYRDAITRVVGVTAPKGKQAAYDGPQPVRNADLGNTVAGIYGLEPTPGSEFRAVYDALTRD